MPNTTGVDLTVKCLLRSPFPTTQRSKVRQILTSLTEIVTQNYNEAIYNTRSTGTDTDVNVQGYEVVEVICRFGVKVTTQSGWIINKVAAVCVCSLCVRTSMLWAVLTCSTVMMSDRKPALSRAARREFRTRGVW